MSQLEKTNRPPPGPGGQATAKKAYRKPAVRSQRVFETTALSCGKVQQTQAQCKSNKKTS
jgi:hypothetical protein